MSPLPSGPLSGYKHSSMKTSLRRAAPFALLGVLLSLAASPALAAGRIEFRLSGAWNRLTLDSVNESLRAWSAERRATAAATPGWTVQSGGDVRLRDGFDMEGELGFRVIGGLSLGLSVGYAYAEATESAASMVIDQSGSAVTYARPTKVSGIPVVISAAYAIPLASGLRIYARAGAGWMTSARFVERDAYRLPGETKYLYPDWRSASGRGDVVQGGLGLRYAGSRGPGFFIEAAARRCRAAGFAGTTKLGAQGKLYSLERLDPVSGSWGARLEISPEEPSGETVRNVRETVIDFGGVLLRLGIIIGF